MRSEVPVVPLIKDDKRLNIKTQTFLLSIPGRYLDSIDQYVINECLVKGLLIGFSGKSLLGDMVAKTAPCTFCPADNFSYYKRCLTNVALSG
jgi:hypothetical protein